MPRGTAIVEEIQKAAAERAANANKVFPRYVSVPVNKHVPVRFLENADDIAWAFVHEQPVSPMSNRRIGDKWVCLNQTFEGGPEPCPGCERGWKRDFRMYANVILRDAPVYGLTNDGKIDKTNVVDHADQVYLLEKSSSFYEKVYQADALYKGMKSRDFLLYREKDKSPYTIIPAVDEEGTSAPTPMSASDKKLAKEVYNLDDFVTPVPYEEWPEENTVPEAVTAADNPLQSNGDATPNLFKRRIEQNQ